MFFESPALWVPAIVLVGAALWDLKTKEVPAVFPLALLSWAVASRLLGFQAQDWGALALGFGAGLALGFGLYLLKFGGGDGHLLAGIGAVLGPVGLLVAFPWMAIAGGAVALIAWRMGRREFAYVPGIAIGYIVANFV